MVDLPVLVDTFVQKVNRQLDEPEPVDDVPEFLRASSASDSSDSLDGWANWHIVRRDNARRIDQLEKQTGRPFPPSFRYFLDNYSFLAFEFGPMMFFANTGENTFWELETHLFNDEHMSPHLLRAGYLQIGNPYFYNYDPVCFDCSSRGPEKRIVQLDHEAILQRGEMIVVEKIARSFLGLLHDALR